MPVPPLPMPFTSDDLARLARHGISPEEAFRQLEQLRQPPPALELDRPCTPGDGIERLDAAERARLAALHDEAASRGELCAFVPASGAASRMFRDLLAYRGDARTLTRAEVSADAEAGRSEAKALLEFVAGLERFAFRDALALLLEGRGERLEALQPAGPYRPLLEALLDPDALGYGSLPKGLIPFHSGPDGPRTAFEEHLAEASALFHDRVGRVRVHATVPTHHLERFRTVLERCRGRATAGANRFDVEFSLQHPATDTLAIDGAGEPFRDDEGELVLRPAGHGALLGNLARAPAVMVRIKNIDNVAAEPYRGPTYEWTRAIVGRLCELRERSHALVRRLMDEGDRDAVAEARRFTHEAGFGSSVTGAAAQSERASLRALLDRPLRVCGMVPNTGEPGGGPFWVRGEGGVPTRQIVESAQVRAGDAAQMAIFRRATHFNPVFLACALDDAHGRRFDLARFVDPDAVIVTHRSARGRDLIALERPGLWNGGMAHWNTVFVEVPLTVFTPVKTVLDLLRREHQPA